MCLPCDWRGCMSSLSATLKSTYLGCIYCESAYKIHSAKDTQWLPTSAPVHLASPHIIKKDGHSFDSGEVLESQTGDSCTVCAGKTHRAVVASTNESTQQVENRHMQQAGWEPNMKWPSKCNSCLAWCVVMLLFISVMLPMKLICGVWVCTLQESTQRVCMLSAMPKLTFQYSSDTAG